MLKTIKKNSKGVMSSSKIPGQQACSGLSQISYSAEATLMWPEVVAGEGGLLAKIELAL